MIERQARHSERLKVPDSRRQNLVRFAANATLVYPFIAVGSLYGCWLLAARILGHTPVAWIDDPAETFEAGNAVWLYFVVTCIAVVAAIPAFIASIGFNVAHVLLRRPSAVQAGIRAFTTAGVWLWFWTWITTDSHEIIKWWMD